MGRILKINDFIDKIVFERCKYLCPFQKKDAEIFRVGNNEEGYYHFIEQGSIVPYAMARTGNLYMVEKYYTMEKIDITTKFRDVLTGWKPVKKS